MGQDRIADHEQAGSEILTSTDMSCLMHLDGLIRRQKKPIRVMHVAEIMNIAMSAFATEDTEGAEGGTANGRFSALRE
jgi:Fe-S oxidoreductase